jgi:hypothetical protein
MSTKGVYFRDASDLAVEITDWFLSICRDDVVSVRDMINYKNYRLEVSTFGTGWKVLIYAPGATLSLPNFPHTDDKAKRDDVIVEAMAEVDALEKPDRVSQT